MLEISRTNNYSIKIRISPFHYRIRTKRCLLFQRIQYNIESLSSTSCQSQPMIHFGSLLLSIAHSKFDFHMQINPAMKNIEDERSVRENRVRHGETHGTMHEVMRPIYGVWVSVLHKFGQIYIILVEKGHSRTIVRQPFIVCYFGCFLPKGLWLWNLFWIKILKIMMYFLLIEFSSKRGQILPLFHVHEINSIFGVLFRPFLFISVVDNLPNTIIHEICIIFVEGFYILRCSWIIRAIYYFLINLFIVLLDVVERTELSCKLLSQFFILLLIIVPSSANINFERVGSSNQKVHLVNLVKLMREKFRVRDLYWKY